MIPVSNSLQSFDIRSVRFTLGIEKVRPISRSMQNSLSGIRRVFALMEGVST